MKSCNGSYGPHAICECMPSWNHTIIMIHTWTYKRNEKVLYIFNCVWHRKEKLALLHNIDIAVVSECLCHLKTQYVRQSPKICGGKQILLLVHPMSATVWPCFSGLNLKRHTSSFVAVDNNPMRYYVSLARISYSLQLPHTWTKHTNIISQH